VRVLERVVGRKEAVEAWRGLLERFPASQDAFLVVLRWTYRMEGRAQAAAVIARRFPAAPTQPADMLLLARALEEIGEAALADAAFARLSDAHPAYELGWLMRAQSEERRGRPWTAQEVLLSGLAAVGPRPRLRGAARRIGAELQELDKVVPPALRGGDADVGSVLLARLAEDAAAGRFPPPPVADGIGPVVMVGGSLAAGGAERQMALTAAGLRGAALEGRPVAGHRLGAVHVVCRALDERPGGAFFLPELEAMGVPVTCYAGLPDFGGDPARSAAAPVRDLLRFLYPRAAEGTARLTDHLRALRPEVVHLWQDGTILACALAALLAGVPRIVLSVRSMPPQDRPERDRPEYALLYPLLARLPGVTWTANSEFAAHRYAARIGMDPARIRVVRNGATPLSAAGSRAAQAMLAGFTARAGAGLTVGAVLRFDENKRPLFWVDCAARLLAARPDARFVMVGDGPLRAEAEAHAAALGIRDRMLFTGRSVEVGFWLAQMDALVLLSRCEGLPNALIEAQAAGVPVVTTPAGGAPETLQDGVTGHVLSSAEDPDAGEVVARLLDIAAAGGRGGAMSRAARRLVAERFPLGRMLEEMVESYVS
jgi:glycosyltransferase involved in cell wall biosynthesis